MNRRSTLAITAIVAGIILSGCETTREQQGQVIGAITGGLLGTQVGSGTGRSAATIVGTILGGYIGGTIGRSMDENDRSQAGRVLESTPTHTSSSWENPDTGYSYSLTPTRTYDNGSQPCREYTTEAWIDGRKETLYGTACRQPDGTWQVAS